jgi:hypothetical protein
MLITQQDQEHKEAFFVHYSVGMDNRAVVNVYNRSGSKMFVGFVEDVEIFCNVLKDATHKAIAIESAIRSNSGGKSRKERIQD